MQFLSSGTNRRTDAYGGSTLNRARFVVELLEAVTAAVGADRTGLKITPGMVFNDISDADPAATYTALLQAVRPLQLAFLEMAPGPAAAALHGPLRALFDGAYFAGVGFDGPRAAEWVADGRADAILFGQAFIANPDLPQRLARGAPLAAADPGRFYAGGAQGYVDYPALDLGLGAAQPQPAAA
jgi:N-ethylmaleimide reductase